MTCRLSTAARPRHPFFYSQKKDSLDLSAVVVPVKLVVVREDIACELVPYISRYTNSQNKVAETDFSSNSEYQVKLSQLSQQVLTPPLPGRNPTHWYYERTRGQYDSERNRRNTADRKQFEKLNPSKQRIKMIDAPKYLMCWDGYPHIASLGSQKCFARFVENESKKGQESVKALDAEFFKQLVCKRILFDTVYKHIKMADWYKGAYQGNIAEYAVAKYALDLKRFHADFDFETIWRTQRINDAILGCLMKAAEQASNVLNDSNRSTQNIGEWAKKEACWDSLRRRPSCLDAVQPLPSPVFEAAAVPATEESMPVAAQQTIAKTENPTPAFVPVPSSVPRHKAPEQAEDARIDDWTAAPAGFLRELHTFAKGQGILSPKAETSLMALIDDISTGINTNALNYLLSRATECGFRYNPPSGKPTAVRKAVEDSPLPKSEPTHSSLVDIDQTIDYQREFLAAITADTWRTILEWARYRHALTDEALAGVAKIDKQIRLTDEQTRYLWTWRQKMIDKGFSASQFAPRPGTY